MGIDTIVFKTFHSATRGETEMVRAEIEKTRADLIKTIAESQRWTITAVGIIVAAVAALQKLL